MINQWQNVANDLGYPVPSQSPYASVETRILAWLSWSGGSCACARAMVGGPSWRVMPKDVMMKNAGRWLIVIKTTTKPQNRQSVSVFSAVPPALAIETTGVPLGVSVAGKNP